MLDNLNGDLFGVTDCANSNIDFAGGVIIANNETGNFLNIKDESAAVAGNALSR